MVCVIALGNALLAQSKKQSGNDRMNGMTKVNIMHPIFLMLF